MIAKLDRLSRDAAFLLGLQKAGGVRFVAADMPEANELAVGIMAVVAQAERKMISERTKAALAAAKARGVRLGGWREAGVLCKDGTTSKGSLKLRPQHREAGRRARRARAQARAAILLRPLMNPRSGGRELRGLARALEERGIPTASRKDRWTAMQVSRVLAGREEGLRP